MGQRQITPPAALAVSLAEARRSARVDVDADGTSPLDVDIAREVRTYTRDAEHKTNRAFVTQTWEETFDAFPMARNGGPGAIQLPKSRLIAVDEVRFYDVDGTLQRLDPADYIVDTKCEPGRVVPAAGRTWPLAEARVSAVEVQYTCGYGPTDAAVPDEAKSYILARVAQYFAPVPNAKETNFEHLLDGLVVYL
jgi:uncharacterized phiE125 gp8 family phage protein